MILRQAALLAQSTVTTIGVLSSLTYAVQAGTQIRRHGIRHWLEVGFEKVEEVVTEVDTRLTEEVEPQ